MTDYDKYPYVQNRIDECGAAYAAFMAKYPGAPKVEAALLEHLSLPQDRGGIYIPESMASAELDAALEASHAIRSAKNFADLESMGRR